MTAPHTVAVVGLTGFERRTLESYFHLGAATSGGYRLGVALGQAELVIVDADLPGASATVDQAGRMRDAVLVGGIPGLNASELCVPRPIDPLHLRRALDRLVRRRNNSRRIDGTGTRRFDRPSGRAQQWDRQAKGVQVWGEASAYSNAVRVADEGRLDRALVVSSCPVERRLLGGLLDHYGYPSDLTASAEVAMQLTRERRFGFVFLGFASEWQGAWAALQVCRQIKRQASDGTQAPVVVAVAKQASAVDRARASFAGCDAYLERPVDEPRLLRLLSRHDGRFERVFEPTAPLGLDG